MTDYYSILSRAAASLDPNTTQARAALFDRARRMMLDRLRDHGSRWTEAEIQSEIDGFEAAVSRIESENAERPNPAAIGWQRRREPLLDAAPSPRPSPRRDAVVLERDESARNIGLWSLLGVTGLVLIGGAAYLLSSGPAPAPRVKNEPVDLKPPVQVKTAQVKEPARPSGLAIDENEVAPGTDGGSTDSGLPYFFRRQAVYYRTTYSAGMIVVDRSQRFLYLVQPQVRALRYGVGIGGECAVSAGLYRITRRAEWPEWSPSPELAKRHSYPAKVPGGPGNPLGARALYFETLIGIHGTNAPKTIGQAVTLGCLRMVNDDVVDLDKRIEIGAGVVVTN